MWVNLILLPVNLIQRLQNISLNLHYTCIFEYTWIEDLRRQMNVWIEKV